ncbi:MAG: Uma2 family endonuclease [Actinomycetia bacterium]|nr:Uma2 family endonuclease [Actinomycetes bacterium]
MTAMTTLPRSRPFTRADLDAAPDDGHRYELIDGVLVVTPAPSIRHQRAQIRLVQALAPAVPEGLEILAAPVDVAISDSTVMQPDLLLAATAAFTDKDLPVAPLLAIEILSPSTRRFDLVLKRARYEAAGCEHYWVVDPDQPRITAWALQGGSYVEVADAAGDEELVVTAPVELRLRPSTLID